MPGDRTCPQCEGEVAEDAGFCPACGAALPERCSKCGAALARGQSFCASCGSPVAEAPATPEPAPSASSGREPSVPPAGRRTPQSPAGSGRSFLVPAVLLAVGLGLVVVGGIFALGSDQEEAPRFSTALAQSGVFDGFNEPSDDGDDAPRGRPSPTNDDEDLTDPRPSAVPTATSVPTVPAELTPEVADGPTPTGGSPEPTGFSTPQEAIVAGFGYEPTTPILNCNSGVAVDDPCFDSPTYNSITEDGGLVYLFRPVYGDWFWVLIEELPDGSFAFVDAVPLDSDDGLESPF